MILEVKNISCGYAGKTIIKGLDFTVQSHDILCFLGPNGVGKTTLFKTILGFIKPENGEITIDGENILNWPRRKFARVIGYVPQFHNPPFPFRVADVVLTGRTARIAAFSSPGAKDRQIAEESMESLNISFLKNRVYTELSGGERQMVLIARALAQQPEILIMDEPTANLDYGNQVRVLGQIKQMAGKGLAIMMTTHYPDHAFLCSSKVALMGSGDKFKLGNADEVVTEENLKQLYDIDVKIVNAMSDNHEIIKACVPMLDR